MLKFLSPKHLLLAVVLFSLAAACALPLQSVQVDQAQPVALATVDTAAVEPAATLAATPAATTAPLPATLPGGLLATLWDEASETSALLVLDPATGAALEGYPPIDLGQGHASARSPDGQTLAVITYGDETCDSWAGGTRCMPSDGRLHFVELADWSERATSVTASSNATSFAFSPDGRTLAIGQSQWPEHTLLMVDVEQGTLIEEAALDFYPGQMRFTADGSGLMVYGISYANSDGTNPQSHAALLDAATLNPVWQPTLPGVLDGQYVPEGATNIHDDSIWWMPATVFAPEAQRLYVLHADEDRLTTVDFAAQSVTSVKVAPAQSWLDRLMALTAGVAEAKVVNGTERDAVLSADGTRLYAVGAHVDTTHNQYTRTPLDLQVIDTATGVLLETTASSASVISLTPDGRHLVLTGWEANAITQILSTNDLAEVRRLDDREVQFTRDLTGQPVLVAQRFSATELSVSLLDPSTLAELAAWEGSTMLWLVP